MTKSKEPTLEDLQQRIVELESERLAFREKKAAKMKAYRKRVKRRKQEREWEESK